MKKFISLFVLAAMMLALIACTPAAKPEDKKVLRVGMECTYAPYNWSQPTNANGVVLTGKNGKYASAKSLADLAGCTSTSQINTVWYNTCLPQIPDVNKLTAMSTSSEMIVALNSGAAEVVVTDKPTAMAAVSAYPNDLVMLEFEDENNFVVSEEEINIGISVQKGNSELLQKINDALKDLNVEDFDRMMNDAIKVQPLESDAE